MSDNVDREIIEDTYDRAKLILDRVKMKQPITKLRGDGTAWTTWQVFPGFMTDAEIKDRCGCDFDFTGGHNPGPGEAYYRRAYIRRTPTRVLVTQDGGLDI